MEIVIVCRHGHAVVKKDVGQICSEDFLNFSIFMPSFGSVERCYRLFCQRVNLRVAIVPMILNSIRVPERVQVRICSMIPEPYDKEIVVSEETESVARKINEERKGNNLPVLTVIVIRMVPAENHVSISTTRIRRGEIDREGHLLRR